LFGGAAARAAVGNAVGFVLWFNFLCGFFYVLAGTGLFFWKDWAAPLSAGIAVATLLVFVAFGLHVAMGGAFELRTVGAMTLRSGLWIAIAIPSCRALGWPRSIMRKRSDN
jgi:ABC-type transport system involved in cytochrome c biogenesis permease subunit